MSISLGCDFSLDKEIKIIYDDGMSTSEILYAMKKTILESDPLLGKVPDRVLAKKYQVSLSMVYNIRTKLKIPASHLHQEGKFRRKVILSTIIPLLGKEKDIEIARRYGVSRERIRQIRSRLHIPKYKIPRKNL